MEEILNTKINELGLSDDTTKWLKSRGVKDFGDILCLKLSDIKRAGNLSEVSRKELIAFVHRTGFRFIKDEKISQDELFVGDLDLPINIIKVLIKEGFIKANDLKDVTCEKLLTLPRINLNNVNQVLVQINKKNSIIEEVLPEQIEYEKLMLKKGIVVKKLNNALKVVERLEQKNKEVDFLLTEAKKKLMKSKK